MPKRRHEKNKHHNFGAVSAKPGIRTRISVPAYGFLRFPQRPIVRGGLLTGRTYIPVSAGFPCYGCGRPDWRTTSFDGTIVICRRGIRDGGIQKTDKNGSPYFLYHLSGQNSAPNYSRIAYAPERAFPEDLDRVNRDLLNMLSLRAEHRNGLLERGLSDDAIAKRGYKSLSLEGRGKRRNNWWTRTESSCAPQSQACTSRTVLGLSQGPAGLLSRYAT
jgi:hypothetical protein